MPSDHEDDPSSRPHSDSSAADDSDSQDSDSMPRSTEHGGVRRKSTGSGKKASNDPHREKRKKAKRACRPCQVAHLTCGDERPCGRCVKRGCAHACKDGVRKKAKYLADTPAEALTQELGTRGRPPVSNTQNFLPRSQLPDVPGSIPQGLYGGGSASSYAPYPPAGQGPQSLNPLGAPPSYGNHPGLLPPNYQMGNGQQPLPLQGYSSGLSQQGTADALQGDFGGEMFAPFDSNYLDNLEFQNRFGAAEFGMLSNLTAGMANSPPSDSTGTYQTGTGAFTPNTATGSFAQSPVDLHATPYQPSKGLPQWSKDNQPRVKFESGRPGSKMQDHVERSAKQEAPPALAIGSSAYPSPSSGNSPQGTAGGREDTASALNSYTNIPQQRQSPAHLDRPSHRPQLPTSAASSSRITSGLTDQTAPLRRHRNPSEVYSNVTQPYSYTAGFHSLTALIQSRFPVQKTTRIAKALAAIRPSFISCTMKLNRDDLIFMEKCLQRTLWGLEEVIGATGTPTMVCRRTGEIVAAGKEFTILTGWNKEVLLGKAPNLNVNTGGERSALSGTRSSSLGGQGTPRIPDPKLDAPVNVISILDDDSACDFFDDYAHLAFGDSRGTITTPVTLLKYKTAADLGAENFESMGPRLQQQTQPESSSRPGSRADPTVKTLRDATVPCMLCWTVKRDVFDIPMLFVMNILPCI